MSIESRTTGFGTGHGIVGDRALLESILISRVDRRARVESGRRSPELDGVSPTYALVLANI